MKRKILQAVIGGAMVVSAGAAMAFDPATTPPTYTVFVSGSSAVSNPIRAYVSNQLCDQSAAVDIFRRYGAAYGDGSQDYGDDWGVACQITNNAPVTGLSRTTANVLFLKRDAGGSGYGVMPVIAPTYPNGGVDLGNLPVIQVGVGVNGCAKNTNASSGNHTEYDCGPNNETDLYSDAGLSDVEPSKFRGQNAPSGFPDYGSVSGYAFASQAVGALTFGIPVNLILRDALQAAQFPTTSDCSPVSSSYTTYATDPTGGTSELERCMPNLTATQIRAVYSGGIESWDNYKVHSVPGDSTSSLTTLPALITSLANANPGNALLQTLVPHDNNVQICRRVPGSGTQATFGIEFLNSPCDSHVLPPADTPGDLFGSLRVEDGSGGKDVGICLDSYSNGAAADGFNSGNITRWAAGVQFTTENDEHTQPARLDYRFIKVNGFSPDIRNVAAGNYPYYAEESYQYRTATNTFACTTATGFPCPGNSTQTDNQSDIAAILAYIGSNAVTSDALAAINNAVSLYPWGRGGWNAIPNSPEAPHYPYQVAHPVNTSTRAPGGHAPNTCQPPIEVTPVVTQEPNPTGQ